MSEKSPRGRPRNEKADTQILKAALKEVARVGFRAMTIEAVAEKAKVGKMTIYRRWPNKAAIVMDAFLQIIGPATQFPQHEDALHRLKLQLRLQAQFFAGADGGLVRSLLGEAQFDDELATAFHERWLLPRRQMTQGILREAMAQGLLSKSADLEVVTDMIYGPFYYRLLLGTGPLNRAFADTVHKNFVAAQALGGQRAREKS